MNTCYIVCALDCTLDFTPDESDFVIGADRGYHILKKQGKRIDLALGDFDSSNEPIDFENVIKFPVMKDETDGAIAIREALARGYNKIRMYGAIGGLIDHTLAIIGEAVKYAEGGVDFAFYSGESSILPLNNGTVRFDKGASGRISVLSHSTVSEGVTIKGLLYTLDNYNLENKVSLGSGNSFIGEEAEISVRVGTLLICTSKNNLENHLTKR